MIKNAVYKVIRAGSADELGQNIVVQGGTFYNDAVLRAFEKELGHDVIRPTIAGLMGAFGAALYSMRGEKSSLITKDALKSFTHTAKSAVCGGCANHCRLTVNTFAGGKKFISGNQCEKGLGLGKNTEKLPNLHEFKRQYLTSLPQNEGALGITVGLPLALGMYELLPLWHGIFTNLGFTVKVSEMSSRATYDKGQFSISSDTACYPAKIMHGHIEELLSDGVDAIFYPCLTYNVDEKVSDNHYNCPVVAYYSELLSGNVDGLKQTKFLYPYLNINKPNECARELYLYLNEHFPDTVFTSRRIKKAVAYGFGQYDKYISAVCDEGVGEGAR